jgi:hypothetical protein
MFVSGLPLTCRSIVGVCPKAKAGKASQKQIDASVVGHFIAGAPEALPYSINLIGRYRGEFQ